MPDSLLSRFDLLFVIMDLSEPELDRELLTGLSEIIGTEIPRSKMEKRFRLITMPTASPLLTMMKMKMQPKLQCSKITMNFFMDHVVRRTELSHPSLFESIFTLQRCKIQS